LRQALVPVHYSICTVKSFESLVLPK